MPTLFNPRSLGPPWALYESIVMILGLGLLGLLCLIWLPCAMVLRLLPRPLGRNVARRVHSGGFRFYLGFLSLFCAFRFDLGALDALRHQGPVVLVANHPSLLDAVMILSRLPNAVCIMKSALLGNPLLGAAARLAGYIPNAGPLEMVLRAREALDQGAQLLLFPEGTRTSRFPLDACSSSAGVIAKAASVSVQTVLIECTTPYLGKAWPLFRRPQLPLQFRVVLGQRFDAPDDIGAFTQQMEQYFRSQLQGRPPAAPAQP